MQTEKEAITDGAYLVLGRPELRDSIEVGRRYYLKGTQVLISTQKEADISLPSKEGASYSVLLYQSKGGWVLENRGEPGSTLLNGYPNQIRRLKDGDLLQIGGTIFHFLEGVGVLSDIYAQLFRASRIDLLTDAYNAAHFDASLDDWMNLSKRHSQSLSLLMIDIDSFKKVNDTYLHLGGNAVLKQIAQRIFKRLRKGDIFCRYGGEELAIILPETPKESAVGYAEEIRQAIASEPFTYQHHSFHVTVSIGVAEYKEGMSKDDFVEAADERLYHAKHTGKNKVVDVISP